MQLTGHSPPSMATYLHQPSFPFYPRSLTANLGIHRVKSILLPHLSFQRTKDSQHIHSQHSFFQLPTATPLLHGTLSNIPAGSWGYSITCLYSPKYGMCMCLVAQSCPTPCNPMDCSPPGSSGLGILLAGILEWVAMPFSRESSQPRDRTQVFRNADGFCTI